MGNQTTPALNVLTFEWPERQTTFYFTEEKTEKSRKLHFSLYPNNIELLFPGITADKERSLYTTFDYKTKEGKALKLDFRNDNPDLLKRHYNNRINYYFRLLRKQLVRVDFIKDNQVWLPLPHLSNSHWDVYEKFTVKVQFCQVSDYPELLISYDGQSKILKNTVAKLIQTIDPICFNRVYYNNQLHIYDKLVKAGFDRFDLARPVLNHDISKAMNLNRELPPRGNPYGIYLGKINKFIEAFINNPGFKGLIPIHSGQLLAVSPAKISITRPESNQLLFASGQTSRVPYRGMLEFGPFSPPKWNRIHLFYIFHKESKQLASDLHNMLLHGESNYKGLQQFARVGVHLASGFSIIFTQKDNPVGEIEKMLNERFLDPDVRYIALYISPWAKTETNRQKHKIYFHIKEMLLKRNITSQTIDAGKIRARNGYFHYSLTNIALALLAKLDGVPWRLNTPIKNELIIGVGAFRNTDTRVNYIGSAFSFDNKGGFNNFEYFLKHETILLAGSISAAVRGFATRNQHIERLIIHFYKTMSERELKPIEAALENLGLQIPVFIVSINKTESRNMVAFDTTWEGLMPASGTYINTGRHRYLLFNNTRYANTTFKSADGYPFPVKLSINCTHKHLLGESQVIGGLIEQVYQFSRLYYKSVRQQGLPITIKYPEMLAEIAPNFVNEAIPVYGKDNLWFL